MNKGLFEVKTKKVSWVRRKIDWLITDLMYKFSGYMAERGNWTYAEKWFGITKEELERGEY